jgi:glycosyltransferase involved in cell wall biosynthesis
MPYTLIFCSLPTSSKHREYLQDLADHRHMDLEIAGETEQTEHIEDALPVVDVVIATYNRPQLLRAAIDAVLAQTYDGRIAVTVVFDRSKPDHSLELQTADRSVRVISNQRSVGLAGARNSGIEAGSGDLVAFCDDDDEWLPTKIEKQVELLQSSWALTCVSGIIVEYEDRQVRRIPTSESVQLKALVRNRTMEAHPSTVLVRRKALLGPIGLVDEKIPGSYGEDFDWILRAAESGSIAVVEEPLVRVRWGQSLFSRKWQTIVDAVDYSIAKHPAFSADRRALGRLLGRRSFALAAMGRRSEALTWARRSLRCWPGEHRAYLAVAVALGLVSSESLMRMAHRRGHGI